MFILNIKISQVDGAPGCWIVEPDVPLVSNTHYSAVLALRPGVARPRKNRVADVISIWFDAHYCCEGVYQRY